MTCLHLVLQVQALTDHRGRIVAFTGPHIGTHDKELWERHRREFRLGPRESILADKAYVSCTQVLHPFKKPRGGTLTVQQEASNIVHSWYRSTVEHAFAYLKRFRILRKFRGMV